MRMACWVIRIGGLLGADRAHTYQIRFLETISKSFILQEWLPSTLFSTTASVVGASQLRLVLV
jgi:hypothetical protein